MKQGLRFDIAFKQRLRLFVSLMLENRKLEYDA